MFVHAWVTWLISFSIVYGHLQRLVSRCNIVRAVTEWLILLLSLLRPGRSLVCTALGVCISERCLRLMNPVTNTKWNSLVDVLERDRIAATGDSQKEIHEKGMFYSVSIQSQPLKSLQIQTFHIWWCFVCQIPMYIRGDMHNCRSRYHPVVFQSFLCWPD